jgi:glycosyltransferase involved in cell wall biosynthesis
MRTCILIPAYDAARTLGDVISGVRELAPIYVIDDGSTDETTGIARAQRVRLVRHDYNRGKGAAIRTGMQVARDDGFDACVTVDADGQHPAVAVAQILKTDGDGALVLGIRDLERAGAPRANQISNGISNFFLSWFSRKKLADTQCGLRRYPIAKTLALRGRADRYAYEAEIVLRSVHAKIPIIEVPIDVFYPPESERVTHFDSVRDPARIVAAVVRTMLQSR